MPTVVSVQFLKSGKIVSYIIATIAPKVCYELRGWFHLTNTVKVCNMRSIFHISSPMRSASRITVQIYDS